MKELLAYRLMFPVTSRLHARSVSLHRSQTGPWGPIRVPWGSASRGGDQCPAKRRITQVLGLAAAGALALGLAACSGGAQGSEESGDLTTVGFVAVGPEGAWRQANEKNMQETFTEEAGFDLKYAPATNLDQKSQIDAFTSFVDEGVDVILLSATEGSGWEDSLKRAQEAEIPVILIDRGIEPDDTDLYVTRIAPDNFEVSTSVADWAVVGLPRGRQLLRPRGTRGRLAS